MTDKTEPTLQDRLRKAKGSPRLKAVLLGMFTAEDTCLKAADALDARDALIADLVEALEGIDDLCAIFFGEKTASGGLNLVQKDDRAALAKAKASSG